MLKRFYFAFCCVVFVAGLTVTATHQPHRKLLLFSEQHRESPAAEAVPTDSFPQRAMVVTYLFTRTNASGTSKSVSTRYVELDGSWREVKHGGGEDLVYNVGKHGTTLQKVKSGKATNGEIPADTGLNTPPAQLGGVAAEDDWLQRFRSPSYLGAKYPRDGAILGFEVYKVVQLAPEPNPLFDVTEIWFAAEIGYTPLKMVTIKEGENAHRSVLEATKIEFKN
jgi:hypothetical protein